MKKSVLGKILRSAVLIAIICSACLSYGCADEKVGDPFSGFYGDVTAECALDIQGSKSEILFSRTAGEIKAEFTAPKTLSGYVLREKNGAFSIAFDGFSLEINESAAVILQICSEAFSPHYSEMTVIRSEDRNGEKQTVIESGGYIYRFSKEGTPLGISGTCGGRQFEITLRSFSAVSESGEKAE